MKPVQTACFCLFLFFFTGKIRNHGPLATVALRSVHVPHIHEIYVKDSAIFSFFLLKALALVV